MPQGSNSGKGHLGWKTVPLADRFWSYVDKRPGDECWNWTGSTYDRGYGRIYLNGRGKRATHAAIFLETGEWIPKGLMACHKCDNPSCVRFDHLFVGTGTDNMRDMRLKGRQRKALKPRLRPGTPCGTRHYKAKFTDDEIRAIRADPRSQRVVAKAYGTEQTAVWAIIHRKTWKHVI